MESQDAFEYPPIDCYCDHGFLCHICYGKEVEHARIEAIIEHYKERMRERFHKNKYESIKDTYRLHHLAACDLLRLIRESE